MAKSKAKSNQELLNELDAKITALQAEKKELAKKALKEQSEKVKMPLHQTNLIAQIGYEKAKEKCGKNWVE